MRRDYIGAAGYAVTTMVSLLVVPVDRLGGWPAALYVLAALAFSAAVFVVLLHRRHPGRSLVFLAGLLAAALAADAALVSVLLLFEMLYSGTAYGSRVTRAVVYAVAVVVNALLLAPALVSDAAQPAVSLSTVQSIVLCTLAVWWGQSVRFLQHRADEQRAYAAAQVQISDSERALSEARSALAVAAERTRFARDMHDLVAGRLAVISLQAAMARDAVDPQRVDALVAAIHECSDATLDEVRSMITALVEHPAHGRSVSPMDGASLLDRTVDAVRTIGVDVHVDDRLVASKDPRTQTLYVVGQELVTNMLRHAAPCRGEVRLSDEDGTLTLQARNTVPTPLGRARTDDAETGRPGDGEAEPGAAAPPGLGRGLRNVAERVAPLGGTVAVTRGHAPECFTVTVRVPGATASAASADPSVPPGTSPVASDPTRPEGGERLPHRSGESAVLVDEGGRTPGAR